MLEATESIQTHFREEVLKMCKEIVDLKLNLRDTEQELGDKMRALSAAEEALFLEKASLPSITTRLCTSGQHGERLKRKRRSCGCRCNKSGSGAMPWRRWPPSTTRCEAKFPAM